MSITESTFRDHLHDLADEPGPAGGERSQLLHRRIARVRRRRAFLTGFAGVAVVGVVAAGVVGVDAVTHRNTAAPVTAAGKIPSNVYNLKAPWQKRVALTHLTAPADKTVSVTLRHVPAGTVMIQYGCAMSSKAEEDPHAGPSVHQSTGHIDLTLGSCANASNHTILTGGDRPKTGPNGTVTVTIKDPGAGLAAGTTEPASHWTIAIYVHVKGTPNLLWHG